MKVKFYGTRGSIPISNNKTAKFGGNTTCLRLFSDCLPPDMILSVDAGSGFVPMSWDAFSKVKQPEFIVLFTHYHYDHTQGLFLAPPIFMKNINMTLCGPVDQGIGPKKMLHDLMRPPYFPVHHKEIESHLAYYNFDFPKTMVIIFHKKGGYKFTTIEQYEKIMKKDGMIPMGGGKYSIKECLVITMHKSRHPEQTVSYRFVENPTGKIFVFLTDHENEDGIPLSFRKHLENADVLVMDSQYSREKYEKFTAGYGHGTPDYCVKVATSVNAKRLGLTHHDPSSTDEDIRNILKEAENSRGKKELDIFACADFMELNI